MADEGKHYDLTGIAVREGDHAVIGVCAQKIVYLDLQSGFLANLPSQGLLRRLADFQCTAWGTPGIFFKFTPLLEQYLLFLIQYYRVGNIEKYRFVTNFTAYPFYVICHNQFECSI